MIARAQQDFEKKYPLFVRLRPGWNITAYSEIKYMLILTFKLDTFSRLELNLSGLVWTIAYQTREKNKIRLQIYWMGVDRA